MSKTGRTARPYAPVATAFLFTSVIEFVVPTPPSFSIRLLEKGSEGSTCGISFKEKLSGHPSRSNGSDRCREIETKNCGARAGYAGPSRTSDPNPAWTYLVRAPHHSCHQGNITDPHFCFHYIVHSSHTSMHMQLLHLNASCRVMKR